MIVREADSVDDLQACYDLRRAVFMGEQGVSEAEEFDGLDKDAVHLLGRIDGDPAATLRMRIMDKVAKIERVCVAKPYRGSGQARLLMTDALSRLRARPRLTHAALAAQTYVIPFYESLGFVAEGPVYDDAGIPHRDMRRAL